MGSWGPAARLGAAGVLVMCAALTACAVDQEERVAEAPTTSAAATTERAPSRGGPAPNPAEGQYDPGDCVIWEVGVLPVSAAADVVPCGEPHRVQVVALVGPPEAATGGYPSQAEWDQHEEVECWPAVERFLGRPLDPYGRFTIGSLIPAAHAWDSGDRSVWCGVWLNAPLDANGLGRLYSEDVREADQATDYAPGTCVDGNKTMEIEVVPCTEPHLMEVVERLAYNDGREPPDEQARGALVQRCSDSADRYAGSRLSAPWALGLEKMRPASWKAGTRTVHCFLGQVDANHEWTTVSEPVPR